MDSGLRIAGMTEGKTEVAEGEGDGGIKKVGKKNFAAVYIAATEEQKRKAAATGATEEDKRLGVGRVAPLSDMESIVLRAFLNTRDYELAAKEAGPKADGTPRLTVESVKRMLRRPNLRAVIDAAIRKATAAEDVDATWVYSEARQVYEGDKVKTGEQVRCLKIIEEMVKPRGAGIVVQQNNINSVYAGMPREVIDAEWTDAKRTAAEGA